MDDKTYSTRTSEEKCPECGAFIKYGYIAMIDKEFRIECPCMVEKRQKERENNIAAGVCVIRSAMREFSGIKTKQRRFYLDKIKPKEGQQEAYKAALAFIKRFSSDCHTSGLLLSGGVGSGKTLLSAAIANAVIDMFHISEDDAERAGKGFLKSKYTPVRFTSTVELLEQLKATYNVGNGTETAQNITDRLKKVPLLVLDDMGAEKPSEWVSERLFEIVDYRYNEELPVIITTNATPQELKQKIGERSFDRLREMCLFIPVTAKSQRPTAKKEV